MKDLNEKYLAIATPTEKDLKEIEGGNLKGFNSIDPQWRIEMLTREYGMCGEGWKFEIVKESTVPCSNGAILLFMQIAIYTKNGDVWSEPIYGFGGEFIVKVNKNGISPNDEAYKMCLTDAIGNASRYIGCAADVYRGKFDDKYQKAVKETKKAEGKSEVRPVKKDRTPPELVNAEAVNGHMEISGKKYYIQNMNEKQLTLVLQADHLRDLHAAATQRLAKLAAEKFTPAEADEINAAMDRL